MQLLEVVCFLYWTTMQGLLVGVLHGRYVDRQVEYNNRSDFWSCFY